MKQIVLPKIPLKRRLLFKFHSFLHLSNIDNILAHTIKIDGAIILMYHSVAAKMNVRWVDPRNHIPPDIFEKHMKFLAKKRNVISLDSLICSIKENKTLHGGTTVITFDDGYLDNLINAAPILKKYNLPATIYLATGYIKREENQWIDQLYTYFNERTRHSLVIPEIFEDKIELKDAITTWLAYSKISKYLIECSYKKRSLVLESINKQISPKHEPPKLTMNWQDVRKLIKNNKNITLGSHTSNHIDISRMNEEEIISEIKTSTDHILRETGMRPVHFSCPYSRTARNLPDILNNLGYLSSVSDSTDLLINSKSNPYFLGRVQAPANVLRFGHYTSGLYPRFSRLVTGSY